MSNSNKPAAPAAPVAETETVTETKTVVRDHTEAPAEELPEVAFVEKELDGGTVHRQRIEVIS